MMMRCRGRQGQSAGGSDDRICFGLRLDPVSFSHCHQTRAGSAHLSDVVRQGRRTSSIASYWEESLQNAPDHRDIIFVITAARVS